MIDEGGDLEKVLSIAGRGSRRESLAMTVKTTLRLYFDSLDGADPAAVYDMVTTEVERPMFEVVMGHVKGNQSRAAQILGISRSTLRKKLQRYDIK